MGDFSEYLRTGISSDGMIFNTDNSIVAPSKVTERIISIIESKHPLVKFKRVSALSTPRDTYSMPAATLHLLEDSIADVGAWLADEAADVIIAQIGEIENTSEEGVVSYSGVVKFAGDVKVLRDPYSAKPYVLFYTTFKVEASQ